MRWSETISSEERPRPSSGPRTAWRVLFGCGCSRSQRRESAFAPPLRGLLEGRQPRVQVDALDLPLAVGELEGLRPTAGVEPSVERGLGNVDFVEDFGDGQHAL